MSQLVGFFSHMRSFHLFLTFSLLLLSLASCHPPLSGFGGSPRGPNGSGGPPARRRRWGVRRAGPRRRWGRALRQRRRGVARRLRGREPGVRPTAATAATARVRFSARRAVDHGRERRLQQPSPPTSTLRSQPFRQTSRGEPVCQARGPCGVAACGTEGNHRCAVCQPR